MKHLLGLDIGTTSLKGCVFDERGREITSVTKSYTLVTEGGFVEFPAERFFELVTEAYSELSAKTRIDAISIDTQGETIIFLDKAGNALGNAIIWLDTRASAEAREIEDHFGLKRVYETTGQTEVSPGYPAPKILWLKRNRPEIFEKVDKILLLEDYLIYRLTGAFAVDRALYSSSLYLDVTSGEYWDEMLDFIGVSRDMLPTLYESGVKVGEYLGIPVSTGSLDQIAGFIGSGITEEGTVSEMTGTALAVCALSNKLPPYFDGIKVPAHYVSKGKYCLLMWAPTAGMALEWLKKTFFQGESFKKMDEEAKNVPLGSEGLVISPNMCGSVMPISDANMTGGCYGVGLHHTRAHFAKAVMESVACLLRQYLEYIGVPSHEIISIGGGSRSKLWLQIKADITGKEVCTLSNKETACLGSAVCAGVGAGIFKDVKSAIENLVSRDSVTKPAVAREEADRVYQRFLRLDEAFHKVELK